MQTQIYRKQQFYYKPDSFCVCFHKQEDANQHSMNFYQIHWIWYLTKYENGRINQNQ